MYKSVNGLRVYVDIYMVDLLGLGRVFGAENDCGTPFSVGTGETGY